LHAAKWKGEKDLLKFSAPDSQRDSWWGRMPFRWWKAYVNSKGSTSSNSWWLCGIGSAGDVLPVTHIPQNAPGLIESIKSPPHSRGVKFRQHRLQWVKRRALRQRASVKLDCLKEHGEKF